MARDKRISTKSHERMRETYVWHAKVIKVCNIRIGLLYNSWRRRRSRLLLGRRRCIDSVFERAWMLRRDGSRWGGRWGRFGLG